MWRAMTLTPTPSSTTEHVRHHCALMGIGHKPVETHSVGKENESKVCTTKISCQAGTSVNLHLPSSQETPSIAPCRLGPWTMGAETIAHLIFRAHTLNGHLKRPLCI